LSAGKTTAAASLSPRGCVGVFGGFITCQKCASAPLGIIAQIQTPTNSQPLAGFLVFCKCGAILSQAFGAVPTSAKQTAEFIFERGPQCGKLSVHDTEPRLPERDGAMMWPPARARSWNQRSACVSPIQSPNRTRQIVFATVLIFTPPNANPPHVRGVASRVHTSAPSLAHNPQRVAGINAVLVHHPSNHPTNSPIF
jgi:hypothetical protein